MFKYEKDDILRRNISKILPYYIGQYHDSFIRRYLETSKEHIINASRIVFGQTSNGFIFALLIFVKVVPNLDRGVRFIAMLRKLNRKHSFFTINQKYRVDNQLMFIQCSIDGNVFAISKSVNSYFVYVYYV